MVPIRCTCTICMHFSWRLSNLNESGGKRDGYDKNMSVNDDQLNTSLLGYR